MHNRSIWGLGNGLCNSSDYTTNFFYFKRVDTDVKFYWNVQLIIVGKSFIKRCHFITQSNPFDRHAIMQLRLELCTHETSEFYQESLSVLGKRKLTKITDRTSRPII